MADWSELSPDIMLDIVKTSCYEDFLNLSTVCTSWKLAAETLKNFAGPSRFPCLILPDDDEQEDKTFRQFYLLSNGGMIRNVMLPEAANKQCLSACGGWLLIVSEDEIEAKLLHPFNHIQIDLPKLDTFPHYSERNKHMPCVNKVVLSSPDSNSADFLVIVLCEGKKKIGYCKLGDASWTAVEEWDDTIEDILYHKGMIYAVTSELCSILVCDPRGSDPTKFKFISTKPECQQFNFTYLLKKEGESDNDKFFVILREVEVDCDYVRDGTPVDHWTKYFYVYEFDLRDGGKWLSVYDLGDRAVFVGSNTTFSIEPNGDCIKPNCIYFTDDIMDYELLTRYGVMSFTNDQIRYYLGIRNPRGKDTGIFNLPTYSMEPLFNSFDKAPRSIVSPPIWFF